MHVSLRSQLAGIAAVLEVVSERLGRTEHGPARAEIAAARRALRGEAARLQMLEAALRDRTMISVSIDAASARLDA